MSKIKVVNRITGKEHYITQNELEAWQIAGIPVKVLESQKPDILKEKEKPKEAEK